MDCYMSYGQMDTLPTAVRPVFETRLGDHIRRRVYALDADKCWFVIRYVQPNGTEDKAFLSANRKELATYILSWLHDSETLHPVTE
jgi:hypothetical protein